MRAREISIPFSDQVSIGRVFVTDVVDEDLVQVMIEKTIRGQTFPGSLMVQLTDAQARKLRDALDSWLRRGDPDVESATDPRSG